MNPHRAEREQLRVAEDLRELYTTAGVLLVDAQGHRIISAKIASTVHDTFHAVMLSELDHRGKRRWCQRAHNHLKDLFSRGKTSSEVLYV